MEYNNFRSALTAALVVLGFTISVHGAEEARHAGKMGGWVVSRDQKHMARIGRKAAETRRRKRAEAEKARH